jgi:hypothetical protein
MQPKSAKIDAWRPLSRHLVEWRRGEFSYHVYLLSMHQAKLLLLLFLCIAISLHIIISPPSLLALLRFLTLTLKRLSPDSRFQQSIRSTYGPLPIVRSCCKGFTSYSQGSRFRDRHSSIALKHLPTRRNSAYCVADPQNYSAFFRQSNPGSLLHDLSCARHARYTRR